MKPQIKIAEAQTPEGETLELHEHDEEFYISVNGENLMSTRSHGSEEELGRMACQPLRGARQPVVLIGGLGMGFTLQAVLESLPQSKAKVIVAEIIPEVVDWNKQHFDRFHPGLLDDKRAVVKIGPVQQHLKGVSDAYHAILLDVDNGPSAFSGKDNDSLYTIESLRRTYESLKLGGLLAVWSAYTDKAFTKRLKSAGFDVSEVAVPAAHKGRRRKVHTIWLAKKGKYVSQHEKKSR